MINKLINKRFSTRAYSEKPVEEEKLIKLFEAARWAPSSMNEQPWRFIVVSKNENDGFQKLFNTLSEGNKIWADKVPVLILVLAKKTVERTGRNNRHSWYDTGAAVALVSMQATEMDLFVHQLGGFNANESAELFEVPDEFEPVIVLAVGYHGNPDELPENLKARENAVRKRKSIDEIVFNEKFGNALVTDEKIVIG